MCVDGDCSPEYGLVSSCTLAFAQTATCPPGCNYAPPEGVTAVQEDCVVNPLVEACRPASNPWGTFVTVADDRCSSLLTTGDSAACTARAPAAVESIDIATNVIILAAADSTIAPDMKMQIQDARDQTCEVTPKNTDLRVASVTDAAITFMNVQMLTGDDNAAQNCVVTGLTGCSYTPLPSTFKQDPTSTDVDDCYTIGGAGAALGDDCNNDPSCMYNDQGTTTPSCIVSYATVCEQYGIKTREGAEPSRTTDFLAGGACIEDADRDTNTHEHSRCQYVDGGTVQTCVPIEASASQDEINNCADAAAGGEETCAAVGYCVYTKNDVSDDYCVALDTGANALSLIAAFGRMIRSFVRRLGFTPH